LGALRQIFPTTLRHVVTMPVYASGQSAIDHWVVRFIAFLETGTGDRQTIITKPAPPQKPVGGTIIPSDLNTIAGPPKFAPSASIPGSVPVDGGIVEIRVGGSGKIIGVNSRWRPFQATDLTKMLPIPSESLSTNYQLVYLLGGDEEPQEFIAPYYRSQDEADPDTGSYLPASDRSMWVDFFREEGSDTTSLSASVSGNAGPVQYSWVAWRIDHGPFTGFEDLGTDSSITLTQGAYNVVLDVEDRLTGAFLRAQAVVYCGPKPIPRTE
jgi:hypothetical protein